jgi:hypothetical protein
MESCQDPRSWESRWPGKRTISIAQEDTYVVAAAIGYHQILDSVVVEISDLHRLGRSPHRDGRSTEGRKSALPITFQHSQCAVIAVGYGQVSVAVIVKVSYDDGAIRL